MLMVPANTNNLKPMISQQSPIDQFSAEHVLTVAGSAAGEHGWTETEDSLCDELRPVWQRGNQYWGGLQCFLTGKLHELLWLLDRYCYLCNAEVPLARSSSWSCIPGGQMGLCQASAYWMLYLVPLGLCLKTPFNFNWPKSNIIWSSWMMGMGGGTWHTFSSEAIGYLKQTQSSFLKNFHPKELTSSVQRFPTDRSGPSAVRRFMREGRRKKFLLRPFLWFLRDRQ